MKCPLPSLALFSLEEFLLYDMPTKGSPIHKEHVVATHACVLLDDVIWFLQNFFENHFFG